MSNCDNYEHDWRRGHEPDQLAALENECRRLRAANAALTTALANLVRAIDRGVKTETMKVCNGPSSLLNEARAALLACGLAGTP